MVPSTSTKVGSSAVRRLHRALRQTTAARALSVGLAAMLFSGLGPGEHAQTSLEVPTISGVVANAAAPIELLEPLAARVIDGCHWLCAGSLSVAQILIDATTGRAGAASFNQAGSTAGTAVTPVGSSARSYSSILTRGQADQAETRLAALPSADRARMDEALGAAAGPEQRAYTLKAFAAGHSVNEVVRFAQTIRGRKRGWLSAHLSLVDPSTSGDLTYHGSLVDQVDNTTCGSASILMVRVMADPLYALYLTTGGSTDPSMAEPMQFKARLAAEEQRIHGSTNEVWPQRLGTSPWGLTSELNRYADATGTTYRWRLVVGTRGGGNPALRDAVTAVDNGQPVPVLIGDWVPRHYVLMVGQDGSDLLFYDPSTAAVVRVNEQDFLKGDPMALGFPHIEAVVTPAR